MKQEEIAHWGSDVNHKFLLILFYHPVPWLFNDPIPLKFPTFYLSSTIKNSPFKM